MSANQPDPPRRVTLSVAEIVAAYHTMRAIDAALAKQGLSAVQVVLLSSFAASPGAPIGVIVTRAGISAPVATRGIDQLEQRGLVRRTGRPTAASAGDRRTVRIDVTEQGHAVLAELAALEVAR